jgi:hypothetical protein
MSIKGIKMGRIPKATKEKALNYLKNGVNSFDSEEFQNLLISENKNNPGVGNSFSGMEEGSSSQTLSSNGGFPENDSPISFVSSSEDLECLNEYSTSSQSNININNLSKNMRQLLDVNKNKLRHNKKHFLNKSNDDCISITIEDDGDNYDDTSDDNYNEKCENHLSVDCFKYLNSKECDNKNVFSLNQSNFNELDSFLLIQHDQAYKDNQLIKSATNITSINDCQLYNPKETEKSLMKFLKSIELKGYGISSEKTKNSNLVEERRYLLKMQKPLHLASILPNSNYLNLYNSKKLTSNSKQENQEPLGSESAKSSSSSLLMQLSNSENTILAENRDSSTFSIGNLSYNIICSLLNDKIYQLYKETCKPIEDIFEIAKKTIEKGDKLYSGHDASIEHVWNSLVESIPAFVRLVISFAKEVPGLNEVSSHDFAIIINNKLFDFYIITHSMLFINGESYMLLHNGIQYTRSWMNQIAGQEKVNCIFSFTEQFNEIKITIREKALLLPLILTTPSNSLDC